jgi:hypothetical protein
LGGGHRRISAYIEDSQTKPVQRIATLPAWGVMTLRLRRCPKEMARSNGLKIRCLCRWSLPTGKWAKSIPSRHADSISYAGNACAAHLYLTSEIIQRLAVDVLRCTLHLNAKARGRQETLHVRFRSEIRSCPRQPHLSLLAKRRPLRHDALLLSPRQWVSRTALTASSSESQAPS